MGLDRPSQGLVISLWRDEPRVREDALGVLAGQLCANWAMCWRPADHEIGHWDRLRLRNFSRGRPSDRVVTDQ